MNDINEKKIINYLFDEKISGYFLAMQSDKILCKTTDSLGEVDATKLIEIRVFNENKEIKAIRGTLGKDFQIRIRDDSMEDNDIFEEIHFLDVDDTKRPQLVTTGGGKYELPVDNPEKIKIRNYLEYDENGICQIVDFRIVKFLAKGDK